MSDQPPPPPAYGAQQPVTHQPPPSVVVYPPPGQMGVAPMRFEEAPVVMVCPHCQANITTSTKRVNGTMVWVAAGVTCLVGCWLGCCLIPLCIPSLKDVEHDCPNCSRMLGKHEKLK